MKEVNEDRLMWLIENKIRVSDVCIELGISERTYRRRKNLLSVKKPIKSEGKKQKINESPLSETLIDKLKEGTKEECINDLRDMAIAEPDRVITRNYYRIHGKYCESAHSKHFGTFLEFKRQAGIILSRQQHQLERHIAKHCSLDNYRVMNIEKADYGDKYIRKDSKRFQTIVVASDLHDTLCDPFALRVMIDTIKRVKPEIIVLNGDIYDASEFSSHFVDPRTFNIIDKIKFVHEKIIEPIRNAAPLAQIDWIAGNHETRLIKHLADATPAMKVLLSDLHGMTLGKLLGLEKYSVNFITKNDLSTYTATNIKSEISKNWMQYFDCFITHHFPEGRYLGMPGVNGHNHKFISTPCYNAIFGNFSWSQNGCLHIKDASYCNAQKWSMGFLIAHIDTHKKSVLQEYIPIEDEFSVSGGKFYYRNTDEYVKIQAS